MKLESVTLRFRRTVCPSYTESPLQDCGPSWPTPWNVLQPCLSEKRPGPPHPWRQSSEGTELVAHRDFLGQIGRAHV